MRPTENTPPVRGDECVVAVINLQDRASHEADVLTSRLGEVLGERIAVLRIGMYEGYVMAESRGHLYFYGPSAEDLAAALLAPEETALVARVNRDPAAKATIISV